MNMGAMTIRVFFFNGDCVQIGTDLKDYNMYG